MASLTRKSTSPFLFACFRDHQGRQCRRSTHEADPRLAQKAADLFEAIAQRKIRARKIRKIVQELCREIGGEEEFQSASIKEYCARWLQEKRRTIKPGSFESYQNALNKFLAFLGSRASSEVCDIDKRLISAWRDLNATEVSVSTVNGDLRILKMLFKCARRDNLRDDDPTEFVASLKRDANTPERRPFTLAEITRVLEVADPEWQSMIKFALYSGQRLGDIAALSWANIDLSRNELYVVTRKRGKRLVIPMAQSLREHVLSLSAPDAAPESSPLHPRAFATLQRDKRVRALSGEFGDLLASAGLRPKHLHASRGIGRDARREALPVSFHSLRHSAVSLLREAGVSEAVTMSLVGHDSVEVSRNYCHVGTDALSRAVDMLPRL